MEQSCNKVCSKMLHCSTSYAVVHTTTGLYPEFRGSILSLLWQCHMWSCRVAAASMRLVPQSVLTFALKGLRYGLRGWEGALLVTLSTLHAQSQGCGMLVHPHCRPGDVFAGCKQCKHPGNRKGSITKHSQRNPCSCCPSNYVAEHHTCQPHPDMPCQCDFHTKETLRLVDKVRTLQKPVSGT